MTTPAEKDAMALAVLDEWAGSCAECDGEGIRAIAASLCSIPGDFEDCDGCADIRQARAHLASRIAELEAEIETHDADRTACHDAYMGMEARAARAEAELAAVREALSFYANAANYYAQPGAGNAIRQDQGNLARAVLAGKAPFLPTYAIDAARGAK